MIPLFLALLLWQPQATLQIDVRSEGKPVEGARLLVNGRPHPTGEPVPVALGEAHIAAGKDGFHPAKATVRIDEAREYKVTVELHEAEEHEEEITVYATRTDARLQDLPLRVEVLSEEEIGEKMMMNAGDITMMLNETGGLRVQTTSPSLGAASVRVQGMRGRYTRFLADGLPLFGQQGGGLGLLQIPPMDLGQVEVIKGVSSALYGAGAMAGVVNLISRRPKDEPVYDVLFNATSLGGTDGVAFLSGKLGERWGASFLGGGHFQQRRDLDDDDWADLAEYQRGVARPRLYYDNGAGRSGFLTGGMTYENRDGGRPSVEGQRESLDTRRYDLGGSYQFLVREKYVFAMRGSTSSQDHDHLFGDTRERDRHRTYFGELSARGTNGRNTWVAGLAADRDEYRPRDFTQFAYTFTTPGIFLQDDIDIAPWLSLSASARADFHSEYGTFFSPRLSALLRGGGWTSRASVGQGFFAPTPLTEETEAAGLARLAIPTPLRAERGRSASFDVSRAVGPVSLSWTAFASRVKDPIYVRRDTRYELVNLDTPTDNAGMEALAVFRKAPFSATASYTYVRSRETVDGLRADVPLTPRHSFGFVGMWEREEWGRVGIESYYTGSQRLEQNPYRDESRRYWIAGVLIEKKLGPVRLFFNMENLTNVRQTRWDPLVRPTRAIDGRWTLDAWAPLDGRVFNGGLRARF